MSDARPGSRRGGPVRPGALGVVVVLVLAGWLAMAGSASADSVVEAFPAPPAPPGAGGGWLPCLPTNPFCSIGQLAGAAVGDVWTTAMLALWQAGLWLLGLSFSVIDALTTPDLSAGGPLSAVYPVTFGIGASVAGLMGLVQLGAASARRDARTLGRLLIGLGQFGLVWFGYVGVAALLVTGVSGLTTGLLRGLLHIDNLASFHPSISVARDLVDGTAATVLGVCSIFLLIPASIGYLLLMLVREAALMVLAATSAISAGGLLAQTSSAWFWKSLRWFVAALLVAPVAVLVLGVGVRISEGVLTGAQRTSTDAAVGMAVVGCLLILLGAICPLVLFRLLAFIDPGTSSGAAMRSSLTASGGLLGALQGLGGRGGQTPGGLATMSGALASGAAASGAVAWGGAAASGAAARTAGDRAQGESTADAATSGRFAGALSALGALATGSAHAGRLAAGAATAAVDVLSGAGVGHAAPYYGQLPSRAAGSMPDSASRGGTAPATTEGPRGAGAGDRSEDTVAVHWPAEQAERAVPGGPNQAQDPSPWVLPDERPPDGGAR